MNRCEFIKKSCFGLMSICLGSCIFSQKNVSAENFRYRVTNNCVGCQRCAANCPNNAIDVSSVPVKILQEKCWRCGKCYENCPTGAIVRENI